jgi:hypothetical protein
MACSRLLRAGPSALRPRAEGVGSAGGCSDGFLCMSRARLGADWNSSWQELWVIVVPVMDGSHLPLAGRVGLPLAVLLALLWGGNSAQPGMTGASPEQQPAVRATLKLQFGILGHNVHVVQPAARHSQGNRRGFTPVAMLAAALAGAVVATSLRERVSRSRRLDGRLIALRPRAPPSCRL